MEPTGVERRCGRRESGATAGRGSRQGIVAEGGRAAQARRLLASVLKDFDIQAALLDALVGVAMFKVIR